MEIEWVYCKRIFIWYENLLSNFSKKTILLSAFTNWNDENGIFKNLLKLREFFSSKGNDFKSSIWTTMCTIISNGIIWSEIATKHLNEINIPSM